MRRLTAHWIVVAFAVLLNPLAVTGANAQANCGNYAGSYGRAVVGCGGNRDGTPPAPAPQPTSAGGPQPVAYDGPPVYAVAQTELGEDEAGESCVRMTYTTSETEPQHTAADLENIFIEQMGSFPACPDQPALPADATTTPGTEAISFWLSQPLPQADPKIPPGRMVVAIPAYLVTNTTLTHRLDATTPFGPLHLEASSHLTVDWGDDTEPTNHHVTGGPHPGDGPNGAITHRYGRSGTYDITVTQTWGGTWSIGGTTGTLNERTVTTTIEDFPVDQIQAVRNY